MPSFQADLQRLLVRDLEALAREVRLFPDDDALWTAHPGVTNSAGNLALHLCGNLQHFIGHVLGGTAYVRDRDREFGQRSGTRAATLDEIQRTIEMLQACMPSISDTQIDAPYPLVVGTHPAETRAFLLHLAMHLGYHLGQVNYLRRIKG